MLTTQIQVLLYVGSTQVVSCSIFVPLPAIVVKSHQTLEAILPYLPLSITARAASEDDTAEPDPAPSAHPPLTPDCREGDASLVLTTFPFSSSSFSSSSSPPSSSSIRQPQHQHQHQHHHTHRRNGNTPHHHNHNHHNQTQSNSHSHSHSDLTTTSGSSRALSTNRVSPDCSIPATTCIKISLQPTPTVKFVKPRCPHQSHRHKNRQHYLQQQQQQQQQQRSSLAFFDEQQQQPQQQQQHHHHHSHHHKTHRHRHHNSSTHHNHHHHSIFSHSPDRPQHLYNRSHTVDHPAYHNQRRYSSSMSIIEYPESQQQQQNEEQHESSSVITVLFTFPFDHSSIQNTQRPLQKVETVQVTGSFNSWERSPPLTKNYAASRFESTIDINLEDHLAAANEQGKVKFLFKFVLDGEDWVTDPQQPSERDQQGNLNNVLFLSPSDAVIASHALSSSSSSPSSSGGQRWASTATSIQSQSPPQTSSSSKNPATTTSQETQEEKAARLRQEEEDDAVIRQLGGGMWGAPMFAVNDSIPLPEHFKDSSKNLVLQEEENVDESQNVNVNGNEIEVVNEPNERANCEKDSDDDIIQKYGGSMWGTPMFAVNDPVQLPEHFVDTSDATSANAPIAQDAVAVNPVETEPESVCAPSSSTYDAAHASSPSDAPVKEEAQSKTTQQDGQPEEEEEEEDENDKIIRELGGGMWGTPFFKINDPVSLPEHFVETPAADKVTEVSSSNNNDDSNKVVSESIIEKDYLATSETSSTAAVTSAANPVTSITNYSSTETFVEGQVIKDEVVATVEGTVIETVVETTEDTVIQAPDGTILEETITTNVQETIEGQLQESITETTEIIEEIEDSSVAAATTEQVGPGTEEKSEQGLMVTMTEQTQTKIVEDEEGVPTSVVEDTLTFTEGPEVDSNSLHSITTSIKPIQEGESILVEQVPVVLVDNTGCHVMEFLASSTPLEQQKGDAKPSVDLSADIDDEDKIVVLQSAPPTSTAKSGPTTVAIGPVVAAGDAKPSIDMSVTTHPPSTMASILSSSSSSSPGTSGTSQKPIVASKGEKRKYGIWKKIKKVLT
ncbi:hypothetical protein BGZ94_004129 [Podila epigama]|nr:hypothetical protein BGZ94_004129 [Podila epigama]